MWRRAGGDAGRAGGEREGRAGGALAAALPRAVRARPGPTLDVGSSTTTQLLLFDHYFNR